MRGAFEDQGGLFSYISPEARIPASHPLRKIRELVREVLSELNRSLGKLYAHHAIYGSLQVSLSLSQVAEGKFDCDKLSVCDLPGGA
jgi:hypothetical protein